MQCIITALHIQKTKESHFIGNEQLVKYIQGDTGGFSQWGGIISTSLNYLVTPKLTLGIGVKYQVDDCTNFTSLSFKMAYQF
ncbi:hypothetical protein L3V35_11875 [Vibrio sp. L5-1]|uniref:hypothetical protein n=1 Tax=Vibrio sp. L5-1 TaxID=2912254 RepID=UPI001F3D8203|nr:hypothetical protein [Vibrio sp. L5-1]MCF7495739.1 hypothetical protein [Vibrio sp. L5-1]